VAAAQLLQRHPGLLQTACHKQVAAAQLLQRHPGLLQTAHRRQAVAAQLSPRSADAAGCVAANPPFQPHLIHCQEEYQVQPAIRP
jgi:hypothetical protein